MKDSHYCMSLELGSTLLYYVIALEPISVYSLNQVPVE